MHHKRRKPKNARAGCLLCKPHKANGVGEIKKTVQERRQPPIEKLLQEHYDRWRGFGFFENSWDGYYEDDVYWDDDTMAKHETARGRYSFGGRRDGS